MVGKETSSSVAVAMEKMLVKNSISVSVWRLNAGAVGATRLRLEECFSRQRRELFDGERNARAATCLYACGRTRPVPIRKVPGQAGSTCPRVSVPFRANDRDIDRINKLERHPYKV